MGKGREGKIREKGRKEKVGGEERKRGQEGKRIEKHDGQKHQIFLPPGGV